MSKTASKPAPLPQSGGSYVRQPDGALLTSAEAAKAAAETKPTTKKERR